MSARNLVLDAAGTVVDVVTGEPHLDQYAAGASAAPYTDALAAQGVWIGWRRVGGAFVDPRLPPFDLRQYAKAQRDSLLSSQVVVVNGMTFPTDDRTTDFIAKANTAARGNPAFSIPKWRLPDNTYVALDNPTIIKVGDTFLNYVGALFVANAGLDEGIAAGTVTTPAQVDAALAQVVASFGG